MKKFSELTDAQQKKAIDKALNNILQAVLEGALRFNDELNGDDLQARIDRAIAKAENMRTPWFAHEYLLADVVVKNMLTGMAMVDAEEALYSEEEEHVVAGIA